MFKKSKKGFTIVELVIVIAVIGILSAILIPTFANLTQQAQQTALKSNLANAYSLYASEAADGKRAKPMSTVVSETTSEYEVEVGIKFAPQEDVFLVHKDATDGKGYIYKENAWDISAAIAYPYASKGTQTLVVEGEAVGLSTFGDYVVYYPKKAA